MSLLGLLFRLWNNMFQLLWLGRKSLKNRLSVYIKSNSGGSMSLDLDPKWDIRNVKEVIAPKLGLQVNEVKIILAGKELDDSTVIEECDLGEQSVLHAVRTKCKQEGSRPLNETVSLSQVSEVEDINEEEAHVNSEGAGGRRQQFYVWCASCGGVRRGKLRVACVACQSGALTLDSDPASWQDVLHPLRITAHCHSDGCPDGAVAWADFYFKCAEHKSQERVLPLNLIHCNERSVPCLACTDVSDPVLVFPCGAGHVTCLPCFTDYCVSRLRDRSFESHPLFGYTLSCPAGCHNSCIQEPHHFKLLSQNYYSQYQRFGAEEFVLKSGGVLCPQPGCGAGIIPDSECTKITCINGCGFVFCRNCLQGYHIGECSAMEETNGLDFKYSVDPTRASQSSWDEASKVAIKVTTKPCPKCRTATERAGGCMHMVCTRCSFEWCWVCQTEWNRACMGAHWFG